MITQYSIAQNVFIVKVCTVNGNSIISNASLRIVHSADYNNVYAFGFTNAKGVSTFTVAENECCIIATCLNYYDTLICLKTIPGDTIVIKLRNRITDLTPVIVNAKIIYSKISKDTITYNLQSVTDGSEKNVGEALQKLPGISIDKNGKVFYQGRKVDQVNVEGTNVFGKMQQLVTQNIDANVISKVDIYRQKSESAFGGEKLILNLRLNAKYKNKVIANFKINAGLLNKYAANINAFKFKKRGNYSFVNSANNIGNSPLTLDDYLEITNGNNDEDNSQLGSQQTRAINTNDFPKFLFSDNKLKASKNIFSAISITDSVKKHTKVQVFALAHLPTQNEQIISEYVSLVNGQKTNESTAKTNELPLFLLDANSTSTLTPTTKLLVNLKANNTHENNNADYVNTLPAGDLFIHSIIYKKTLSFNTNISIQKNITEFASLSMYVKYGVNNQNRTVSLQSNQPIYQEILLFNTNSVFVENRFNTSELQSGINYGIKKKYPFYVNINLKKERNQNESMKNMLAQNPFALSGSNTRNSINESFSTSRNLFSKLSINIGATVHHYLNSFTDTLVQKSFRNVVDYRAGISLFTKRLNQVNLNFSQTSTMPALNSLYNYLFIDTYRDLYKNGLLVSNEPNMEKNISITYISVKALKAKNTSAAFIFINGNKKIVVAPVVYPNYIINNNYYLPKYIGYMAYLNDDRYLINQALISKINVTVYHIENNYFFNDVKTKSRFSLLTFRNSLISTFNKSKFQLDLTNDIKFTQYSFYTTTKLYELQPSLTLKWNEKTYFYELSGKKLFQYSNYFRSNSILNIGFSIRKKVNQKYEFSASGDNIFNLHSPNLLSISQNNVTQSISNIKISAGYIMAGFRYNF